MVKQSPLTAGFMSLDLSVEVLCRALGVPCVTRWRVLCEAVLAGDFGMAWSRCGCGCESNSNTGVNGTVP